MTKYQKNWIDNASYETLLAKWRFAPMDDPMFQGDIGEYYTEVMHEKGKSIGHDGRVSTSKTIGWEG